LTAPSQAAVVLTVLLSAGMVAVSPEFDITSLLLTDTGGWDTLLHQDASVASLLDRLSFEWEMSPLPASFQQVVDQMAPVLLQQQSVWQDTVATLSTQLQDWTNQAASQMGVVQDVVANQLSAFQATASDFVNRCTEVAAVKTSALQVVGQSMFDDLSGEAGRFSSQAQAQYTTIEALTRNTMDDVATVSNQWQEQGSRILAQYGGLAMEKYRDLETVARSEMKQIEQVASQLQADGDRILSKYAGIASEKYAALEQVAQAKSEVMATAWNAWKQDASIIASQYNDMASKTYRVVEQESLEQLKKFQDQLELASLQAQSQASELVTQGKTTAASKWAETEPVIQSYTGQLQSAMVDFREQLKETGLRFSAEGEEFLRQQLAEAQRVSEEQFSYAKAQYLQNAETSQVVANRLLQDVSVEAREASSNLAPAAQQVQRSAINALDSFKDTFASSSDKLLDQVQSWADATSSTTWSLKDVSVAELTELKSTMTNKFVEAKSSVAPFVSKTSLESEMLKDTLQSMLD
jgi:hypothetical protein